MEKASATPAHNFVTEGAQDEGEEDGEAAGDTDLNMEGISNLNSELSRVHIAEKNKAMAEKLKVCVCVCGSVMCMCTNFMCVQVCVSMMCTNFVCVHKRRIILSVKVQGAYLIVCGSFVWHKDAVLVSHHLTTPTGSDL